MWKLEVEEACWGTVSVFTVKLEDLELYEWVLVIHEHLLLDRNLLTNDQLWWEVANHLGAVCSSPVGCQIGELLLLFKALSESSLLLLLKRSKSWRKCIEMGNSLSKEVILISKVLILGSRASLRISELLLEVWSEPVSESGALVRSGW